MMALRSVDAAPFWRSFVEQILELRLQLLHHALGVDLPGEHVWHGVAESLVHVDVDVWHRRRPADLQTVDEDLTVDMTAWLEEVGRLLSRLEHRHVARLAQHFLPGWPRDEQKRLHSLFRMWRILRERAAVTRRPSEDASFSSWVWSDIPISALHARIHPDAGVGTA